MLRKFVPVELSSEGLKEEDSDFLLTSDGQMSPRSFLERLPPIFNFSHRCKSLYARSSNLRNCLPGSVAAHSSISYNDQTSAYQFLKPNRTKAINQWLQTSRVTSSGLEASQRPLDKLYETDPSDESTPIYNARFSRNLLMNPLSRHKTHTGLLPAIPSVELDIFNPESPASPQTDQFKFRLRKTSSAESPSVTQKYFGRASVEYDSDTGWKAKIFERKRYEELEVIKDKTRERKLSRESLKLDLKDFEREKAQQRVIDKEVKKSKCQNDSMGSLVETVQSKITSSPHKSKDSDRGNISSKHSAPAYQNDALRRRNTFERCSLTSMGSSPVENFNSNGKDDDDDVFETSKASNSAVTKHRNNSVESKSSVKIKNILDCFETPTKSNKSASTNAIAKPNSKPTRGSLKKISQQTSNSDYDRDRGRSRHMEGGHRDSFKKNERTNEQNRDPSDRNPKDGSLNRSLSNTDTNLEDRIGGLCVCLLCL